MTDEIINRVANSRLKVLDLEDYYPKGKRIVFDLKPWLYEGFVLREKEFRKALKAHDWSQYEHSHIALTCSTDAIVPAWAYMLIATYLEPFAKTIFKGNLEALEASIYQDIISKLDLTEFQDQPVIIKGCSNKPVPLNAYTMLINKLKPLARSVKYGEACSAVPLYKRR
ncbi:MAG: DUF2480 family protein [Flavobacteriaceae bacterium]|nr:DUF2480 family protein [Flavobacteriaceae bacterium]